MASPAPPAGQLKKCERPGCPVQFIPYRTQKYCTPRCKKIVTAYKHALRL